MSLCNICFRDEGAKPPLCGRGLPNATWPDMADCYQTAWRKARMDLAAAEERGRRRGVEGLTDAKALLRNHVQYLRELRTEIDDEICPDGAHIEWCSDLARAIERIDAALAPRDSAPCPEGDPLCGCQKSMDAPPDSGKGEP